MNSARDEIDRWLDSEVAPLYPKAGALERIQGHARRRKRRQALATAAGCAVVLAAAVTVPQYLSAGQPPSKPHNPPVAAQPTTPTIRQTAKPSKRTNRGDTVTGHGTQIRQHTYLTTGTSGTTPPANFRPTSVTVVGAGTAANPKLVGAVLGQAGPPCFNPRFCTSMAGTASYGSRWYGVSAPVTTSPRGASGVSQLRFTNLRDGWAFGPALYETSGGGWPWQKMFTAGLRVTDLEAVGQEALAPGGG